ncbi:MAG: aryl-sulfate sulfotransferase [Fuerstiella sp.]
MSWFHSIFVLSCSLMISAAVGPIHPAVSAQETSQERRPKSSTNPNTSADGVSQQFGVLKTSSEASPGYTLLSPLSSLRTFLIDLDGHVVHWWDTDRKVGQTAYLMEDGTLWRAGKSDESFQFPDRAGSGGRIQKYDWDGNLLWDYNASSKYRMSHHDIEPLPNGNVLCIVWEAYDRNVAEEAGRNPIKLQGNVLWFEAIFELKPVGKSNVEVVWKWSLLDHLVQDHDKSIDNFGLPNDHPELVDVNSMLRPVADWIHMNSIDYNEELDQILVSSRALSEIWVIDHSTTTEEASGHTAGRYKKGGDLLYRWGNPKHYREGDHSDRMCWNQHDAQWIPKGLAGAGNMLIFNNGLSGTDEAYSTIDEFKPPQKPDGTYQRNFGSAFGPTELTWTYEDPGSLFSPRISGAQRLPNGNTLICSGTQWTLLEVTAQGKVVWQYRNPPRFIAPPNLRTGIRPPAMIDRTKEEQDSLRIPNAIPLEDGGTLFRAIRYPVDYPAFEGRDLSVKSVPKPERIVE